MRRLAFVSLVLALATPAGAPAGAQGTHPAVSAAKRAQQTFERARRGRLPVYNGVPSSRCDERIGRLCYWNNNEERNLPPERAEVARRRDELLAALARAAEAAPADDWVAGQRVAYLIEARRFPQADSVAAACGGTRWWCEALRGLAAHARSDHAAAATAFDGALAAMSPEQRCRWTDVSLWLEKPGRYERLACGAEREAWERRFWWMAQPLLMLPGNELRSELLSRRVMIEVHAEAASPHAMAWGEDMAESELRYGWPTAWVTRPPSSPMLSGTPDVVGYEPTPSFDFVPEDDALANPGRAVAGAWDLESPQARSRYAPRYVKHGFRPLAHQIARFRRGDSTVVVGAWDVAQDAKWDSALVAPRADSARRLDAGLVLVDSAGGAARAVRPGLPHRGALAVTVAALPRVVSLEVLDTVAGRAARARYAVAPLAPDAPVSDVLLLERGAGATADLEGVLADANGSPTVRAGGVVGLYWESYLPTTPERPVTVSVRATRLDTRWYERARSAIGLGEKVTPVAVRFADVGRPDGKAGRSLTLTWPSVPPGDYRLELTVTGAGGETGTASQRVRVER